VIDPGSYYASPINNFTFNILNGKFDFITVDLYVSPEGDNSNSGLSQDDPFKTIQYAFTQIIADSLHHSVIMLMDGTYSPSTNGEEFPLIIPDFITLTGLNKGEAILDGEGLSLVMNISGVISCVVSNLSIVRGNNFSGGGIYCAYSNIIIEEL